MDNEFVETMQKKSEEELRAILENEGDWQLEAVEAAEYVLGQRERANKADEGETLGITQKDEVNQQAVNEWHYEVDGARKGPVSEREIKHLIAKGDIQADSLVWRKEFVDWKKVSESEFAGKLKTDTPPPLSGDKVNNTFIWVLAFAPMIGAIAELYYFNTQIPFFTIILNSGLAIIDTTQLKKAGYDSNNFIWAIFLIPVYLWRRANLVKQPKSYFWVWILCFVVSLVLFDQGSTGNGIDYEESAETYYQSEEEAETVVSVTTFKIGEGAYWKDYYVQVANVVDPYISDNEYNQPESGNKFVAIEVVYKNLSQSQIQIGGLFDWNIIDSKGYAYSVAPIQTKTPALMNAPEFMNPEGIIRGWVLYEVLENSQGYKFLFSNMMDGNTAEFQ